MAMLQLKGERRGVIAPGSSIASSPAGKRARCSRMTVAVGRGRCCAVHLTGAWVAWSSQPGRVTPNGTKRLFGNESQVIMRAS